jgi:hypothetical protein
MARDIGPYRKDGVSKVEWKLTADEKLDNEVNKWRGNIPKAVAIRQLVAEALKLKAQTYEPS